MPFLSPNKTSSLPLEPDILLEGIAFADPEAGQAPRILSVTFQIDDGPAKPLAFTRTMHEFTTTGGWLSAQHAFGIVRITCVDKPLRILTCLLTPQIPSTIRYSPGGRAVLNNPPDLVTTDVMTRPRMS
jgi:hypothetical protein